MKNLRELVGPDVGLLDLPADDARALVQEQSYIVDYEPERALRPCRSSCAALRSASASSTCSISSRGTSN